ncbi:MAG: ribosomal-processing cysteine protease Prp [Lachnospiraceae bacterium]|nr:ribosomal-processing cysteine protease Prp [Lachnospiraceae bacterium]
MTKITIYKNQDNRYIGFDCIGHAGYANEGEDVVCAGISTLVINTINSIGCFTEEEFSVDTQEESGEITFRLKSVSKHDSYLLLQSMILGLQGIMNQYGDSFIRLDFKEV